MLVLVVGPSGAGKDTLLAGARATLAGDTRIRFVRRAITRPADCDSEDHEPLTPDAFATRLRQGAFALHWQAHGLSYGIPADIADAIVAGRTVVANVSRGVISAAAARLPVHVIEVTAAASVLAQRLRARRREGDSDIAARLSRHAELPAGIPVTRIANDSTIEEGVTAMVAAISRATETARVA
jgi:phosphonate metabolism protein PhnN/1,5-bisphosphokinase (PRPP-forming)